MQRTAEREIEILVKLNKAGAQCTYFYDKHFAKDAVFFAMQFCEQSLGKALSELGAGSRTVPERWALARGLVEALASVHAAGVFHNDIKAENVLLAGSGASRRVLLADFNLAWEPSAADGARTSFTMSTFRERGVNVNVFAPELIEPDAAARGGRPWQPRPGPTTV